jgi:hypothetical protein
MENVREILASAIKNLNDSEVVAITAEAAREIGLSVDAGTPDARPLEFKVSEIRDQLDV